MTGGLIRRLADDRRGVSAVEFALLAPVMVVLYLGLADICQGYMAQKRMGHVASIVADLVAQEEQLSAANIDDFFQVGVQIMKPFSSTTLYERVSSITRDATGVAKVDWSRGHGMTRRAPQEVVVLPANLIDNGETVIMAEATYDYDSPIDYLMPTITHFRHVYYLRPRTTQKTTCADCT